MVFHMTYLVGKTGRDNMTLKRPRPLRQNTFIHETVNHTNSIPEQTTTDVKGNLNLERPGGQTNRIADAVTTTIESRNMLARLSS